MNDLHFTDVTPEDGKKYKHNSESETNSPYIVVSTYEGVCPSNTFAGLPETPNLLQVHMNMGSLWKSGSNGMLSVHLKSTLRIGTLVSWLVPSALEMLIDRQDGETRGVGAYL